MGFARLFVFMLSIAASVVCLAQSPTTQATEKLREREKQRQAERAKIVQVTAGELEDLQTQIRQLRAQNDSLSKKISALTQANAAPVKKKYTELEIGMTKQEVLDFVRDHPRDLRIDAARYGTKESQSGVTRTSKTTVKGDGTQQQAQTVQESIVANDEISRDETIVITTLSSRQVSVGMSGDVLGGQHEQFQTQYVASGRINVTITGGVVSALEGQRF